MRRQVMPYARSMTVFAPSCVISRCLELMITLTQNTRTRYYSHCHKIRTCSISHAHTAKHAHAILLTLPQNRRTHYYSCTLKISARSITQATSKHLHAVLLTLPQNTHTRSCSHCRKTRAGGILTTELRELWSPSQNGVVVPRTGVSVERKHIAEGIMMFSVICTTHRLFTHHNKRLGIHKRMTGLKGSTL